MSHALNGTQTAVIIVGEGGGGEMDRFPLANEIHARAINSCCASPCPSRPDPMALLLVSPSSVTHTYIAVFLIASRHTKEEEAAAAPPASPIHKTADFGMEGLDNV